MHKSLLLTLVASLIVWSAAAQTTPAQNPSAGASQQQPQQQNVPITPESGQRTQNPQRGEDVGQQGKGMPVEGQGQAGQPGTGENQFPASMPIVATLSKGLDAKKVKAGDQVNAKVEQDVLNQGNVVLPRGSRLIGHVTTAKPHKGGEASELGIAWDRAVTKNGKEIPLRALIVALAPPPQTAMAEPAPMSEGGGMAGSVGGATTGGMGQPPMGGQRPTEQPPVGEPTGGYPSGTSGSTTSSSGGLSGPMLTAASKGVQGMPGVTLSANAAQGSIITSERDNVKLNGGTQLVLRVANQ